MVKYYYYGSRKIRICTSKKYVLIDVGCNNSDLTNIFFYIKNSGRHIIETFVVIEKNKIDKNDFSKLIKHGCVSPIYKFIKLTDEQGLIILKPEIRIEYHLNNDKSQKLILNVLKAKNIDVSIIESTGLDYVDIKLKSNNGNDALALANFMFEKYPKIVASASSRKIFIMPKPQRPTSRGNEI